MAENSSGNDMKKYLGSDGLIRLVANVIAKLNTKADVSHNHDSEYYTESEIDNKIANVNSSINTKADASHNHDSRYYTESEIDAKVSSLSSAIDSKVPTSRTVNGKALSSNITLTASDVNADASGAADGALTSAKSYADSKVSTLSSQVDTKLAGKSDVDHTHDALVSGNVNVALSQDTVSSYNLSPTSVSVQLPEASSYSYSLGTSDASWDNVYAKNMVLNGTNVVSKLSSLDSDISAINTTLSGKANASHTHTIANVSGLQNALDAKSATGHKHTVSDIMDLTATAAELNYMDGVTSNVQTQIDNLSSTVAGKANSSHSHTITASASDDDVVVLTGTSGTDKVTYSASHANSGVAAGTYKSVTVDARGHVVGGSSPTTLSGYGITDAYTKTQIDSKVSDLEDAIDSKGSSSHTHTIADVTNLQATLDAKASSSHTHNAATTSAAGFMSASDKSKLDGIASGANAYTLPVASSSAIGGVKSGTDISVDTSGNVSVVNDSHTHSASTITSVNASAITGTIPSANLPSYVDDVLEYNGTSNFPTTGETGKIYVDTSTNKIYRWGGTAYAVISDTIALGETSSTAYRGDRGKTAYDHSQATGNPHGTAIGDISGLQSALDSKASSSHTHNYAGSSTAGGSAASAVKLDTSAGSATQPVYFSDGKPVKTTYTLEASVPSGAKFTDTTYSAATTSAAGLMSAADKTKLNGIATGAEVNQNAFANVIVGDTQIAADAKSDSLTLIAGDNVTLTPSADNDSVTIASKDTVYTHPTSGITAGTYKSVTVNAAGHVTAGSNPTTLSGYGITDAASKSHTHTVSQITDLTATAAELNKMDGVTATTAELNYVDGVTSNIQSQLDGKQASVTGGASTITSSNLTASRALVSNSSGKVAVSDVTSTELGYLDGVTSNVQTQLNSKAASSHTHNYAGSSSAGGAATSAVKLSTARTISLTGDVAGSASFDGSANASISTTSTSMHGITTSGTGAAYTATVSGITSLTAGASFIMIPNVVSTTTTPTLNVNSLGAKGLRMHSSAASGTVMTASSNAWLTASKPIQVTYDGTYWIADFTRPAASTISGTVPIANGGTGATTAADARTNLGAAASDIVTVSSTQPTSDTCLLWVKI